MSENRVQAVVRSESGLTLVRLAVGFGVVLVVVVLSVATATFSIDRVRAAGCRTNLRSIREVASDYGSLHGSPTNLDELAVAGRLQEDADFECPASGAGYLYNLKTGGVQCLTPGHENF